MAEFDLFCAPYRGTALPTDHCWLGGIPTGYPVGPGSPHRIDQGLALPFGTSKPSLALRANGLKRRLDGPVHVTGLTSVDKCFIAHRLDKVSSGHVPGIDQWRRWWKRLRTGNASDCLGYLSWRNQARRCDDQEFIGTMNSVGKPLQLIQGKTKRTRWLRRQILLLM